MFFKKLKDHCFWTKFIHLLKLLTELMDLCLNKLTSMEKELSQFLIYTV